MKTSKLAAMAWRNLWRQPRRTLITLSSIGFGTMLAILFTGMGDANFAEMIDLAARLGGGHVTLQHPEYLDTPTLGRSVADSSRLRELALLDHEVEHATSRITGHVMLAAAGRSYGAAFIAYDPQVENKATLAVMEALAEGKLFGSAHDSGIVLGQRLARNLHVRLGHKVVYTLTDKEGEIAFGVARLSGIVRTGSPSVDAGLSLFPIDTLRAVLGYAPGESTQVALFLADQRRADGVVVRLGRLLDDGTDADVAAIAWHRIQPELAGFIAMKVASTRFMEGIILILVAAGIFNTLFVSVMERLREFGTLLAIGFSPGRLFALVMCESLWLGWVGIAAGALLTAWPYFYLATTGVDIAAKMGIEGTEVAGVAISSVLRVAIYPENALWIAVAALVATLLAGLYPAWRAGHLAPVEAIRLV